MHDSFNNFAAAITDPYWVLLAAFISGLALGWLMSTAFTFVDYLVQLFHRLKLRRKEKGDSYEKDS